MRLDILALLAAIIAAVVCRGCAKAITFPSKPAAENGLAGGAFRAYDTDGDRTNDFFLLADADGRVDRIGYSAGTSGRPDEIIRLDDIPAGQCPHLVLILDGFGFDVLERYYAQRNLRVFHRPSRLIAPYPTLTDPAMQRLLNGPPPRALESAYFNRQENELKGGPRDYLAGINQPYNTMMDYRAGTFTDAIAYVAPWKTFISETGSCMSAFERSVADGQREFLAYFVSSAGISTADGEEGQRRALERVEQMVLQTLQMYRGKVKITLLADHGHSYTAAQLLDFDDLLKDKGWQVGESLKGDKSVVPVPFGLVTTANFVTGRRAELAADLIAIDGVELVSYLEGDAVAVLGRNGQKALIRRAEKNAYRYSPVRGDPLRLQGVLDDFSRSYTADEMLALSGRHDYPIPLQRLWGAHHDLVQNPPDVIASLANDRYYGATYFSGKVKVASTHGSLNKTNSTTFIMSTAGPLPPLLRSSDVHSELGKLLGRPFPQKPWRK
ncbi:MAG: hypothetical protein ABFD92_20360 [Planctomycetaceae bacterium]|nr:hypothetical protein [Planctomycetaceae bacterium]